MKIKLNTGYQSPSTFSGTKKWMDINNNVHDIELTDTVTESDNQKESTKTALNKNKVKEIYKNSHLCFE